LQDLNADKTFDLMKEVSGGLKASIIIGKAKSKTGAETPNQIFPGEKTSIGPLFPPLCTVFFPDF